MKLSIVICLFLTVIPSSRQFLATKNLIQVAEDIGASTLVNLINKAGLTTTLQSSGNFTIFAPTDAAFSKVPKDVLNTLLKDNALLANVLKYHVASGNIVSSHIANEFLIPSLLPNRKIRINSYDNGRVVTATGSRISRVDIPASNGVIHLIDNVMYPLPQVSLLQYLSTRPNFTQLVYNSIRANIGDELKGGPFTVFAPMDPAFYALPAGYLNNIFLNMTASKALMNYHIVKGTFYSVGLRNGENIQTVNGRDVRVTLNSGDVMIEKATVLQPDISITNGVIHVIDKVLIPDDHMDQPPVHEVVG